MTDDKSNAKKKRKSKKQKRRDQSTSAVDPVCDYDGAFSIPSEECSILPVASEDDTISVNPTDSAEGEAITWESYWTSHGEFLVWRGWLDKYPNYLAGNHGDAIPAEAEVEVTTSEQDDQHRSMTEESVANAYVDTRNIVTNINVEETKKLGEISIENLDAQSPIGIEKSEADSNVVVILKADLHPVHTQCSSSNNPFNQFIERTLKDRCETVPNMENDVESGNQNEAHSENIANQNTEIINMMHCYSRPVEECQIRPAIIEDSGIRASEEDNVETEVIEDYGDLWKDLWNEHYTETYWFYYNQFDSWYGHIDAQSEEHTTETVKSELPRETTEENNVDDEIVNETEISYSYSASCAAAQTSCNDRLCVTGKSVESSNTKSLLHKISNNHVMKNSEDGSKIACYNGGNEDQYCAYLSNNDNELCKEVTALTLCTDNDCSYQREVHTSVAVDQSVQEQTKTNYRDENTDEGDRSYVNHTCNNDQSGAIIPAEAEKCINVEQCAEEMNNKKINSTLPNVESAPEGGQRSKSSADDGQQSESSADGGQRSEISADGGQGSKSSADGVNVDRSDVSDDEPVEDDEPVDGGSRKRRRQRSSSRQQQAQQGMC